MSLRGFARLMSDVEYLKERGGFNPPFMGFLHDSVALNPAWSALAFGVKGNGTDDTIALQRALDAQETVYLPAGTYAVSQLRLNTGNRLIGEGHGVTVVISENGIVLAKADTHSTVIEGFTLTGCGIEYVNTSVPLDESGAKHVLRDICVEYVSGNGVHLDIADGSCLAENVYVLHATNKGFSLQCADCTFVSCIAGQSGEEGFYLTLRGNNIFVGCKSFRSGRKVQSKGSGFLVNTRRNYFFGCASQDNVLHGVDFYQADENVFTGVVDTNGFLSQDLSQAGVRINGGSKNRVDILAANRTPSDLPQGGGQRYSVSLVNGPLANYIQAVSVSPLTSNLNGSADGNTVVIV